MNTKAAIQPAIETSSKADTTTRVIQTETTAKVSNNKNGNSRENGNNNHPQTNREIKANTDLVNDFVVINNTVEGDQNTRINLDEETIKTFNYSTNSFVIVKPVIGLTNYSNTSLKRLKELYMSYRQNSTVMSKFEESEEQVQNRNNLENSGSVIISRELDEFYNSEFEKWNNRRLIDGLLCQNDSECQWIHSKLRCKADVRLNFDANEEWFDNWHQNKSHGVCFCIVYHVWSDRDMECWHPEAPAIPPPWAIAIGVGIALLLIVKLAILLKLMV